MGGWEWADVVLMHMGKLNAGEQKIMGGVCRGGGKVWVGSPQWRSDSLLMAWVAWSLATIVTNVNMGMIVYGLIGPYVPVVG